VTGVKGKIGIVTQTAESNMVREIHDMKVTGTARKDINGIVIHGEGRGRCQCRDLLPHIEGAATGMTTMAGRKGGDLAIGQ
jgi:hypothetical protein